MISITVGLSGCDGYLTQSVRDIHSAVSGAPSPDVSEVGTMDLGGTVSEVSSDLDDEESDPNQVPVLAEPEIPTSGSEDCYVYNTLSAEERVLYDQVCDAIYGFKEDVTVSTTDKEELKRIYECVLADHGDIFWSSGYTYHIWSRGDEIVGFTLSPNFTMDESEKDEMARDIDTVLAQWLEGISLGASDYEKAKYIYQTLINNVAYDSSASNNQNIISVFIDRATVCQGYANAAAYMAKWLGLQSSVVTGYANGELHAWNLIRLDGEYYYMDVTWGNSAYSGIEDSEGRFVNYAYLNITSEEIAATHTAKTLFPLPECRAYDDNYYHREGKWFETCDMDAIGHVFENAYLAGEQTVSVKLADVQSFNEVHRYFIEDSHIADYCPGITSISYLDSDDMCVLTLMF